MNDQGTKRGGNVLDHLLRLVTLLLLYSPSTVLKLEGKREGEREEGERESCKSWAKKRGASDHFFQSLQKAMPRIWLNSERDDSLGPVDPR